MRFALLSVLSVWMFLCGVMTVVAISDGLHSGLKLRRMAFWATTIWLAMTLSALATFGEICDGWLDRLSDMDERLA